MPASLYPQVMTTKTKPGHTEDDLSRQLQSTQTRRKIAMHVCYFPQKRRSCTRRPHAIDSQVPEGPLVPILPRDAPQPAKTADKDGDSRVHLLPSGCTVS
jgi:hypothetical protein